MLLLKKPTPSAIDSFLAARQTDSFSYPQVGASRHNAPTGYKVDHNRVQLGQGGAAFALAVAAIRSWTMFKMDWCHLYPANAAIEVGTTVAVTFHHFGFWSLNSCRIVYCIDEDNTLEKFGFAYGTLEEHAERGEERFSVEWDRATDSVWYDIYAFSRPHHPLAKIGYPLSRMLQKRFVEASKLAMVRAAQSTDV